MRFGRVAIFKSLTHIYPSCEAYTWSMHAALAHHCVMFLKSLNSAVVCAAVIGLWGLIVKNYAASVVAMVECVDREC